MERGKREKETKRVREKRGEESGGREENPEGERRIRREREERERGREKWRGVAERERLVIEFPSRER